MTSTYTITLRVYQGNPNAYFCAVENAVCGYADGGAWTEATGGETVLTMGGSGTCATRPTMDVKSDETGATIQAQYHNGGSRASRRERQLYTYSVTGASGRKVSIEYTVASGKDLKASIVIE